MKQYGLIKTIKTEDGEEIKLCGNAFTFILYKSYFGIDNDISVACCGSSLSAYQVQLLVEAGAEEIIVAFDRQFQEIGDKEFQHLKSNLLKLHNKHKNFVKITFIFDKEMITGYKTVVAYNKESKVINEFNSISNNIRHTFIL